MNKAVVATHDLHKQYRLGKTTVEAIRGITLAVSRGEFFAIAGPSGSGKTTLLNLIGCLDSPSSGEIEIEGEAVGKLKPSAHADLRARKIGFIFQTFNLIPVLTAYENVEYPLLLGQRTADRRSRVETVLTQVGLADRARHRPTELSGGQQQRVAVARALVTDPAIVLADEPTANLDSKTGQEIIELMHRLNRERGTTFIFSTHDPRIMKAADRVVEISDGRLLTQGA